MIGPPASGKTTWANKYIQTNPGTIAVSRDKLREMLFGYSEATVSLHYADPEFKKREDQVTVFQHTVIRAGLESGRTVIVDDTNCDADRIKKFVRDYDRYAFQMVLMPVTLDECLERNAQRTRQVDADTIKKMYARYERIKERYSPMLTPTPVVKPYMSAVGKPKAYLFDLDGTMAQIDHRASFNCTNEEILADVPIMPVVNMAALLEREHDIIFLSGREDKYYDATMQWLGTYLPNYCKYRLLMRPTGDYRKDSHLKAELFDVHIRDFYDVQGVFDDRKQVKQMWVDRGLFVFDCNQKDVWF